MAKTSEQKEAEAAAKRQQALTDAQASGDQDTIARAQAEIDTAFADAEAAAEQDAEAAAKDQEAAQQAADDAQDKADAAAAAAFQARGTASTEALIAEQPGRQVPYLPTQVLYRLAPAPQIAPQQFRQVTSPATGHITNEGIGAEE